MTTATTAPPLPQPLAWAAAFLNEAVMGFLAIVALATAMAPEVFDLTREAEDLLRVCEWIIVAIFAAEFLVQLAVARDRRAWLRSPWRIVDVVCILGPVAALLPQVSEAFRGSLALRLLRLSRAVVFGARAGSVAARQRDEAAPAAIAGELRVAVVTDAEDIAPAASTWTECLTWTREPHAAWYHVANLDGAQLQDLIRAAGIHDKDSVHFIDPSGKSRIQQHARHTSLVMWLPTVAEEGFPEVTRHRLVVLIDKSGILTASTASFDVQKSVAHLAARLPLPELDFPARMTCALLMLARERHAFVARRLEEELRLLEEVRVTEGGAEFLQQAFRLQRELAAVAADLWRLEGLMRTFADGRTPPLPFVTELASETEDLHEELEELKDALKSLMELHINVRSFEMNKFMKLLAIVSFLGLIPSVTGGLLGMNVDGNPWHVTLGQVTFGVVIGMVTSLYVFAIRGWLR
jgi:Mg2+ and Co2+ transporter CorA